MDLSKIFPTAVVLIILGLGLWGGSDVYRAYEWVSNLATHGFSPGIPDIPPTPPIVPPTPMPAPVVKTTGDFVQLGSYRNSSAAHAVVPSFSKFSDLFDPSDVHVYTSKLPTTGTWYRVMLPVDSRKTADKICSALKGRGQDCFAVTIASNNKVS